MHFQHLQWMMQKDLLGQDVFLIGGPGPLRRGLAMQYLELTKRSVKERRRNYVLKLFLGVVTVRAIISRRESEYVALSRDTTESDLKQRREIEGGTAKYVDQSAVRAASQGRVLVLEGIEKVIHIYSTTYVLPLSYCCTKSSS